MSSTRDYTDYTDILAELADQYAYTLDREPDEADPYYGEPDFVEPPEDAPDYM